jgi:beta-glucosidase
MAGLDKPRNRPRMTPEGADARVERLLDAMTLAEKLGQLSMLAAEFAVTGPTVSGDYRDLIRAGRVGSLLNLWGPERVREVQRIAVEETRLGIPLFFGFDTLHGHHTVFPSPLGEAASFDPELWRATARAAACEAAADGIDLVFAPMLDVARDPRWGRIVEGPGEDPYLASRIAVEKVDGFQGQGIGRADCVAATIKHFVAYGAATAGREYNSAEISERALHEVYLPPFRAAIARGAAAVMPAFQDLAGVPMTAHAPLLRRLLRETWGFDGVLVSDYAAVAELTAHGVAADLAEAAALALCAGVDIDMMGGAFEPFLGVALARGLVAIEQIDAAVRRVLRLKQRLGLFDDPCRRVDAGPPDRNAARALSRDAAVRSAVLLGNPHGVLPLDPALRRIAVVGPLADRASELLGPWAGTGDGADPVSLLEGLRAALPDARIAHEAGVAIEDPDPAGIGAAAAVAAAAELVVLCLGEAAAMSGEAASRARLDLPGAQRALAAAILALGVPVVIVLVSGRPLMIGDLADRAAAILAAWHPGSEGGNALADLLTGRASPGGRLPVSWPRALGQVPIHYAQRPTGRPTALGTHYSSRYIDLPADPLFPFGHGLAYTRFAWTAIRAAPARVAAGAAIAVECDIENTGERAGEETGFLFIRDPVASVTRPLLELRGFAKVSLAPGEAGTMRFTLATADLAFPGAPPDFAPLLEPGDFEILAGPSAERARLLATTVRLE